MAEEVKKIITVEVGKSITSIRDFKKHIEDLRGSLLGLNEESEEYKTIAEQIATDQAKLNDVMKIGKTNTDAAAGSYVELNNQLKALRNQYKALSETERNGATGQAILQNITKLDTELKNIDESMGQYQRNVGNYKQAFEGAFQTILGEISKINPTLGAVLSAVQKLIPAFKGVGTAAKAAGTSIKSAMASTGIGLLVVALGEIIAHWEEISNWARRVLGIQKDITAETKNTADQAKLISDRYKDAVDYANKLKAAQGKTPLEIANDDVEDNKELIDKLLKNDRLLQRYIDAATEARARILADNNSFIISIKDLPDVEEDIAEIYNNINEELLGRVQDYAGLIERQQKLTAGTKAGASEALRQLRDFLVEQQKINDGLLNDAQNATEGLVKEQRIQTTAYITETEKRAKAAENALKAEVDTRKAKYEEDKAYAEQTIKDEKERNKALENLEREFQADMRKIYQSANSQASSRKEQEKQKAEDLFNTIKDYGKDELELLDQNYVEQLVLLEKYGYDTTLLTKKWCEAREKIVLDQYEKDLENQKRQQEKLLEAQREALSKDLDQKGRGQDWRILAAQNQNTSGKDYKLDIFNLFPGQERPDIQKEREQIDLIYQIEQQGYMDRIDLYQNYLTNLEEGSQEYLETERAIHSEKMNLAELEYEHDQELNRRVIQDAQNRRQIITTIASDTASVWSSITDAILVNEAQGSEKWKAFKTSEAVVNMLSGILAAFMSGFNSGIPAPWNIALATSTAAVAAAAGAAQIAQIRATKMGSTSTATNATGGASGVGVSPLLNPDYDLQRITNLSLQGASYAPGNTQVYVLESDIQEVGNRVQVRENNATF